MPWLVTRHRSQTCNFIDMDKLLNIDHKSKVSHRELDLLVSSDK